MSSAESSDGGMGVSRIDVRREAVVGYEDADARTIDRRVLISRVVGRVEGGRDWKRSGCLASINPLVTTPSFQEKYSRSFNKSWTTLDLAAS